VTLSIWNEKVITIWLLSAVGLLAALYLAILLDIPAAEALLQMPL
jgi:hypothetical protein